MKTTFHTYSFDLNNPVDKTKYEKLVEKFKSTGVHRMRCIPIKPKDNELDNDTIIELETEYLSSNQWNTTCGHRVFDWFEEAIFFSNGNENKTIKLGHYLDITSEMTAIRENTLVCGYCGKFTSSGDFCTQCLDSEYLKQSKLHLLRLLPVSLHFHTREPLAQDELATLLPEYIRRQTAGNAKKLIKQRADIIAERQFAETKCNGMLWLLDHGVNIDNVIYYSHTNTFSFGWRQAVSDDVAKTLLGLISEFPYPYDIKGQSRSWQGGQG